MRYRFKCDINADAKKGGYTDGINGGVCTAASIAYCRNLVRNKPQELEYFSRACHFTARQRAAYYACEARKLDSITCILKSDNLPYTFRFYFDRWEHTVSMGYGVYMIVFTFSHIVHVVVLDNRVKSNCILFDANFGEIEFEVGPWEFIRFMNEKYVATSQIFVLDIDC